MPDIYQELAQHLDRLPGGYPATDSGVEIKILKKLFTQEQARIAAALTLRPKNTRAIAKRLSLEPDKIAAKLDIMASKGLIFRINKSEPLYMAAQFVIGIWEYHVNDLDTELIEYFNDYIPYLFKQWTFQKTKQLRVIPISQRVTVNAEILPYEIADEMIRSQSKIVVAPCICRKEHRMVGQGCAGPLEVCLIFGSSAHFYEKNGLGRSIEINEALDILAKGIDAGLVLQPGNAQKTTNICMCCGCCCQILKNIKALPQPAKHIHSNYFAQIRSERCTGCGACAPRCHMEALIIEDQALVELDRCIGCGVCVPACETEAISLAKKSEGQLWQPPETLVKTYRNISKERGLP